MNIERFLVSEKAKTRVFWFPTAAVHAVYTLVYTAAAYAVNVNTTSQ
jgi:hypothetical protein